MLRDCVINIKNNGRSIGIASAMPKKVLMLVLQSFFEIYIGIVIGNTFCKVYWDWYCQYFLKVLLTTLLLTTAMQISQCFVLAHRLNHSLFTAVRPQQLAIY